MRVLVSIPVHEEPDAILAQLRNFQQFLRDPVIVLHVSRDLDIDPRSLAISPRVVLNPERYATAWGTGICAKAHLSNLNFARRHLEFDYALLCSSNELLVRHGLEAYLADYDAAFNPGVFQDWYWRQRCMQDRPLRRMLRRHGLRQPVVGQLEGSFFSRELLEQVLAAVSRLEQETPWQDPRFAGAVPDMRRPDALLAGFLFKLRSVARILAPISMWFPLPLSRLVELLFPGLATYPREEVYFITGLSLCRPRRTASCITYMNWRQGLTLTQAEVDAVRQGRLEDLPEGAIHLAGDQLFSVKRVERKPDDPLRSYISTFD